VESEHFGPRCRRYLASHGDGNADFSGAAHFETAESLGADADDGKRNSVGADGLPEASAIGVEPIDPVVVAEHCERMTAGNAVVICCEQAPERWLHAERIKIIA